VFQALPQAEKVQSKLTLDLFHTLKEAMLGMLPVLPKDVIMKSKPIIETVPVGEIDAGTMEKIEAPAE